MVCYHQDVIRRTLELTHKKSYALDKFIEFKVELESKLGKHIKALQSNQDGEYMYAQFDYFLKKYRIISQLSPPRTPQ